MGTRSSIAVKHGNNIKAVYCHWDGYLEHNGAILLESYDSAKANNLVALGDISFLNRKIGEKHPFSPHSTSKSPAKQVRIRQAHEAAELAGWTTFYGRDRGETGCEFRTFGSESEWVEHYDNVGAEYYYLMDNGVWYVSTPDDSDFVPLHEAMERSEV